MRRTVALLDLILISYQMDRDIQLETVTFFVNDEIKSIKARRLYHFQTVLSEATAQPSYQFNREHGAHIS